MRCPRVGRVDNAAFEDPCAQPASQQPDHITVADAPLHDPDDPSPHAAALVDLPTPLPPARVAELGTARELDALLDAA